MTTSNGRNEFGGAVAVVTGAAGSGIGQATARRLASGGARVVITDVHQRRTEEVSAVMALDYPDTEIYGTTMDIGKREDIDDGLRAIIDRFGRVDMVINNAAINFLGPTTECDPAQWDRVMDVNINGPWYLSRQVFPLMRDRGGGIIVNVSSYAADIGGRGLETPYAVSKGALNTLTRCLAHEGGPLGIRVNSVTMGIVTGTKFVEDHPELIGSGDALGPLGIPPAAADIAEAIAFLASPRSAHITGETINVSSGAYMRT